MGKWNELFHYSKNLFTTLGGNYTDFIFSEHLFMADSSMFMVSEIDLSLSFSVAKATLELQLSVCLSICNRNPSASRNCSYRPSSLSTIEPIDHRAYQPSTLPTIKPIGIDHRAYRPSSLSTIKPINHQAH